PLGCGFRDTPAESLFPMFSTEACGQGITEQEHFHRLSAQRTRPYSIGVQRVLAERFADALARNRCLTCEQCASAERECCEGRSHDEGNADPSHGPIRASPREHGLNVGTPVGGFSRMPVRAQLSGLISK